MGFVGLGSLLNSLIGPPGTMCRGTIASTSNWWFCLPRKSEFQFSKYVLCLGYFGIYLCLNLSNELRVYMLLFFILKISLLSFHTFGKWYVSFFFFFPDILSIWKLYRTPTKSSWVRKTYLRGKPLPVPIYFHSRDLKRLCSRETKFFVNWTNKLALVY